MAGKDPKPVLREGVPAGLIQPLRQWLNDVLSSGAHDVLARIVCLRLNVATGDSYTYATTLAYRSRDEVLLDIADAILQLNANWEDHEWADRRIAQVRLLEIYLIHSGSIYEVDWDRACLTRRVDPAVKATFDQAVAEAREEAGDHLRTAFAEAYGMEPNPDTSYDESVRAVEAAYCPLVLNKQAEQGKATLGTVLGELRSNPKWRLGLPDKAGNNTPVDTVVGMIGSLWEGQVSRHAGSPHSRRQTQPEAEAAVHLAATLVHWGSTGVVFQT